MPSKSELESPAKTSTTGTGAQVQENGNEGSHPKTYGVGVSKEVEDGCRPPVLRAGHP
jgi:hypothetical protein